MIRTANLGDAEAVHAIYAPYVRGTAISFELEVPSVEDMRQRLANVLASHTWLVFEEGGQVIGYAYAAKIRERAAYQWSAEAAVYVSSGAHRKGVGRALYSELFERLRSVGFVNLYAGITLPNEASVALHESMGFEPICAMLVLLSRFDP